MTYEEIEKEIGEFKKYSEVSFLNDGLEFAMILGIQFESMSDFLNWVCPNE